MVTQQYDPRHEKRLKNAKENFKNGKVELRRAEVEKLMHEAGIDMDRYWMPSDSMFDGLERLKYFNGAYKQRTPIPFESKKIREFVAMPKARLGMVEYVLTPDRETIGSFYVGSEGDGARNTLFAFSIVCKRDPSIKYTDFNIKLDMCVGGKEWMPLIRLDTGVRDDHRNIFENGVPVDKVSNMRTVGTPHLHLTEEFTQLYGQNLGNDSQAYNKDYVMDDPGDFKFGLSQNNPIFNQFLMDLAARNRNFNDPTCTATFTEIMTELARQQSTSDPNFFKNCVSFVGAMAHVNVMELFNENVGSQLHFGKDAPGVINNTGYPLLEDAVYGQLGGME